ncbi:hypothetical protein AK812_SmicGene20720 [Symbiodinium microadriaticum]|uniref:Uncharacterized protein n=1 Tax=Symbiodinium microadriaticum TaxID=2951 RepID=A0A1Q9DP82_SYMMI|nr:hypothetical protein AK812_SmicGene20720 [Symbiodinium microadriaticum]
MWQVQLVQSSAILPPALDLQRCGAQGRDREIMMEAVACKPPLRQDGDMLMYASGTLRSLAVRYLLPKRCLEYTHPRY